MLRLLISTSGYKNLQQLPSASAATCRHNRCAVVANLLDIGVEVMVT